MNILFLATHANTGGITSYLRTLGSGLVKQGHRVVFVSSGGDCDDVLRRNGIIVENLNIKTKSELSLKIYFSIPELMSILRKYNIEVIHANTRVTQVLAAFVSLRTKIPYVTTCHGFFKPRFFRKNFPCWGKGVVAISSQVVDHLQNDFQVSKDKITLIENGIDTNEFYLVNDHVRLESRLKLKFPEFPTVGIIARLSTVKGQDVLINAIKYVLAKISTVRLVIVGEGGSEKKLRELVDVLSLRNVVTFIPAVNQTMEYLSTIDVFVMPSRQEGLGLGLIEAMACGLPVIGTRVGGIPSLIEHEKTGLLVEPENPQELAEAIIQILNNKNLSIDMGLAAREFVRQHFDSKRMVKSTETFYRMIVSYHE